MDEDHDGASLGHRQEKILNGYHAPVIAVIAVIAVVSRASAAGPIEEDPQPVIQGAWQPWRHVPRQGLCLYGSSRSDNFGADFVGNSLSCTRPRWQLR